MRGRGSACRSRSASRPSSPPTPVPRARLASTGTPATRASGPGRDIVLGHAEIARLLIGVVDGTSLRSASADLRRHILRSTADGTSRRVNPWVNHLDAYAAAVLAELHPRTWPRVVVLDAR